MPEDIHVLSFDGLQIGKINIPKQDVKVPEPVAAQVKTILDGAYEVGKELNAQITANSTLQAQHDELEKSNKELQEKFDAAEKGNPEVMAVAVKARLGLEKTAAFFKIADAADMSDVDLRKAVILSQNKDFNFDGKDDAYIVARFDIYAEEAEKGGTALAQLAALGTTTAPTTDDLAEFTKNTGMDPSPGREAFMKNSAEAFRNPPGKIDRSNPNPSKVA